MLMISRRIGETIVIGDIEITVTEIHRKGVRLAVKADASHLVLRGEVRDAIEKANRQAAQSASEGLPVPEPGKPKAT
ncbi:MAG TPA: carbon storage regulator [Polyangiaceae bacterium]|jgi:carbon storage regulator CsrA|nr:carbon storage regulator [Polyangiaceae bacterium]